MTIVSAAVIIDGNNVLLAKRAKNEKLAGFWEFPGGKQKTTETIQSCLERELQEELGIKSKASDILFESVYDYEGASIRLIAIFTTIETRDFKLSVHDEIVWANISEILSFELAPADIPIAKEVIKLYGKDIRS